MAITSEPIRNGVDTAQLFGTLDAVKAASLAQFSPGRATVGFTPPRPASAARAAAGRGCEE